MMQVRFYSALVAFVGFSMASALPAKGQTPPDTTAESRVGRDAKPTCAFVCQDASPLATLVEIELLKSGNATWLERNRIDALLREQELQKLLSPDSATQRVALGRLLKARVLVMLRNGKKKDVPCVDLVICETERGLRLLARTMPLANNPENDATAIAALVDQAIGRAGSPIREIYAVPPFLSKNLAYDHDYLRTAYARLIEQSLLEQPDTLVVELAEAEAIAREVGLSGETPARRLPLFVLGEYRHKGQGEDARVQIALKLRRGDKQLAEAAETVPATGPADFFHKSLAAFAKAAGAEPSRRSGTDQAKEARELARLAAEHQRLGNWNESLCLAEASLLLKPDQPEMHRLALIATTGVLRNGHHGEIALLVARRQHYRRGLQHMETLIRSGSAPEDYQQASGRTIVGSFLQCHTNFIDAAIPQDIKDLEETVQQEHRETLMRVARFFAERGQMEAALHYCRFSVAALDLRQQYAEVLKMIIEFQDVPGQARWITHGAQGPYTLDVFDAAEGREFLANLTESPLAKPNTKQIGKAIREAVGRAVAQRAKETAAPPAKEPLVELPAPGQLSFRPIDLRATAASGVTYSVRRARCIPAGDGVDFFWDSTSLFVMKTKGLLWRIRDEIREGFVDKYPGATYQGLDVVYDGRYVWVIAQAPPVPQVLVVDPVGERVWELGQKDGLPLPRMDETPSKWDDYRVLVAALGPGEVCMAGGFGRAWVALVGFDPGGRHRIHLFHEAREIQNADDREQWKKTTVAFRPSFMVTLQAGHDAAGKAIRRVLLGRGDSQHTTNPDLFQHPLLIDPEKPSVEVVQQPLGTPKDYDIHDGAIYLLAPLPKRHEGLAVQRIGLPDLMPTPVVKVAKEGMVVFSGERLNVVGKQWWAGLLSEKSVTCLGNVPWYYWNSWGVSPQEAHVRQPEEYRLDWLGRSNHYGLLARYYNSRGPGDSPGESVIAQVLLGDPAIVPSGQAGNPGILPARTGPEDTLSEGRQGPSLKDLAPKVPPHPQLLAMASQFRPYPIHFSDPSRKGLAVVSPSGQYLALGTDDGTTILWSRKSINAGRVLAGHERQVELLNFSANEKRLVTYGHEGTAKIWDVDSGKEVMEISDKNLRKVTRRLEPYGDTPVPVIHNLAWRTLVLSPDGKLLVAVTPLVTQFWNLDTKQLDYYTAMFAQVGGFLPDGTLLALAGDCHRSLIAWDPKARTGRPLAKESCGDLLAISPDGRRVAMQERVRAVEGRLVPSCRLAVWDVSQRAVIGNFDGDPHRPVVAAFSPDGKTLTIGLGGGTVRTWNVPESAGSSSRSGQVE